MAEKVSVTPKVPTYKEIEIELREVKEKYNLLVQKIRQEGKKKVDDGDAFLRSYWRNMK
jgi:hypothetical protein